MTDTTTRVGLIQLCATPDVPENLKTVDRLVNQAVGEGAEVVLLPEAFAFIGRDREKRLIVETLPGPPTSTSATGPTSTPTSTPTPIFEHCSELASRHGIDLVLGGHHEAGPDPEHSFNTCVHLNTSGAIAAVYRKIHLFDVNLADGTRLHESARTAAGSEVVATSMPFGQLGLTICYDVRFPYLFQSLVDLGAVAISVPSAFTATTGAAHWHTLLKARAIETQCYVLAPAQYGNHHGRRVSYGHSLIIDPWGETVAERAEDTDGVVIADIDPDRVREVREQLPSLQHRRCLE